MYDVILVPVDGSETAGAAVEHAAGLAEAFDATVKVLYVADTRQDSVTLTAGEVLDVLVGEGERVVAEVAAALRDRGIAVEELVEQGDPASAIVGAGARADLVVMGTHGRRGIERYLLGSVTERVLRRAETPVYVVRAPED